MDPATLISTALAGINLMTKLIAAVQVGNLDEAQALLKQSREHFSSAINAWDAATGPTE